MVDFLFSKRALALLPLVGGVVVSIVFFFYLSPTAVIDYIGIENAYVLMFAIAALGGMTTFNTVPYFSVILLLASAGVNPLLLGISSAGGVMAGDSYSYLVGQQGATIIPAGLRTLFTGIFTVAERYPRLFPLVCFVYGSISPLSNDFITIPAGMAKISYWRVMIPLGLGNMVFNVSLAYLSIYAYDFVQSVFVG